MRIVTAHTMVENLRALFERVGFLTAPDGDDAFVVTARQGQSLEETRGDVVLMLRLWCAMHPEIPADATEYA